LVDDLRSLPPGGSAFLCGWSKWRDQQVKTLIKRGEALLHSLEAKPT